QLLASPAKVEKNSVSGFDMKIATCTLWAPACTVQFFKERYEPALDNIDDLALFTLTDKAERDDNCANIYHKSLLYLVSNAFESGLGKAPFLGERQGEPILGMAKFISPLPAAQRAFDWILSPNANGPGTLDASA